MLHPAFCHFSSPVSVPSPSAVFHMAVYTGNGSARSITTGLPMSTSGGLVWIKSRSGTTENNLFDSVRGATKRLSTNYTSGEGTQATSVTSFNSNGFSLGADSGAIGVNVSGATYQAWSFLRAAGFLDIVTYAGTGSAQAISHSLGSVPGMIIVKRTDTTGAWAVYHRQLNGGSSAEGQYLILNTQAAESSGSAHWNNTAPTSSAFTVGSNGTVNTSGGSYVAYVLGHENSSTGRIFCGGFSTDGSGNASISMPFQPQFVMLKCRNGLDDWKMLDTTRGWASGSDALLAANQTSAEDTSTNYGAPGSGGFTVANLLTGGDFIFMAMRG